MPSTSKKTPVCWVVIPSSVWQPDRMQIAVTARNQSLVAGADTFLIRGGATIFMPAMFGRLPSVVHLVNAGKFTSELALPLT